ncbi:MAG: hypothetical protein U0X91_27775 [Spirosomataceae bacterium]
MKKDRRLVLLIIFVLVAVTGSLTWLGKDTVAPAISTKTLKVDTLDTERQLLTVRADSVLSLIKKLQIRNAKVFNCEDEGTALTISGASEQHNAFHRIFFNEASLSSYAEIQNTQLNIATEAYQFTMPIQKYKGVRFVTLPAEVMQSMLLSIEP